jgi:hypothetical protein
MQWWIGYLSLGLFLPLEVNTLLLIHCKLVVLRTEEVVLSGGTMRNLKP